MPAKNSKRGTGSRFSYQPKMEDVKKRAERPRGRFDSPFLDQYSMFKPRAGDNTVRILPPTWDNPDHFGLTVFLHKYVGPDESTYLCPRKMNNERCPVCDAAREAKESGEAEEAKALRVQEGVVYWILDRESDTPEEPLLWLVSTSMDQEITQHTIDKKNDALLFVTHEEEGYDLTFRREGQGIKTRYKGLQFDRSPSPIHNKEKVMAGILEFIEENPLTEVLRFYDEDYLDNMINGTLPERDDADEDGDRGSRRSARSRGDEEEERPSRSRGSSRRGSDDSEEEEEQPRSRRSSRQDDGEDRRSRRERSEEAEDEEVKQVSRRRGRDDSEEEEDEEETPTRGRSSGRRSEDRERSSKRSGDTTTADRGSRRSKSDDDDPTEDEEDSRSSRGGKRSSRDSDDDEEERPSRRGSERVSRTRYRD